MEAAASEEALQRKKEEVAFKVVQYYLMARTAGGYVEVAEKSLEDAQEHSGLPRSDMRRGWGFTPIRCGPRRRWRKPGNGSSVPRKTSAWPKGPWDS